MEQKKQYKNNSGWITVGTLTTKKDQSKGKYTFKVGADVTLKQGEYLVVQDPRERLKNLLTEGKISEEQYEERLAKIPDFVKFEFVKGPARD